MKPYDLTRSRVRTITYFEPNSQGGNTSVTLQSVPGRRDRLVCPVSNPGDRKNPTNWDFTKEETDYGDASLTSRSANGTSSVIVGPGASSALSVVNRPSSEMSSVYNEAVSRLYDQLRGQLDLSIDAFQSRQAKKMIKEVGKLLKFWRSFKPSELSNRWLEYQYGWKPLVSTIHDLASEAVTPPKSGIMTLKARAKSLKRTESLVPYNLGAPGTSYYGRSKSSGTLSERVEVGCTINLAPSALTQLARISSLNPASIAWELLPYSFVIDWVIDIGGYLRSAESAMVYSSMIQGSYVSRGIMWDEKNDWGYGHRTSTNSTSDSTGHSGFIFKSFNRTGGGVPFPDVPRVNASLGSSRLLSAAALMHQHIKR